MVMNQVAGGGATGLVDNMRMRINISGARHVR